MTATLPPPSWPHQLTTWGIDGDRYRSCSCGATVAGDDCMGFAQVSRLLVQAGTLIRATGPAGRSSSVPASCLTAGARRQRGLAYLALLVDALADPAQQTAPGPAAGRDARGESRPSPAVRPVQPDARLAPGAEGDDTDPPTGPDPATPAGYRRVTWATCGHSADAPNRHDWAGHRHWCPGCEPGRLDDRCPGVRYANIRRAPLATVRRRRCAVCGDTATAALYPGGTLCDQHAPWAVAGRPDPRLGRLPVADRLPPDLRAVSA